MRAWASAPRLPSCLVGGDERAISYGDFRLLHEARGHLCLDYEVPEVVTLIELALLFGWDAHLILTVGYARAFVSHDQFIEIGFDEDAKRNEFGLDLERAEIPVFTQEP